MTDSHDQMWNAIHRWMGPDRMEQLSSNDHSVDASISVANDLIDKIRAAGVDWSDAHAELQTFIQIVMLVVNTDNHGEPLEGVEQDFPPTMSYQEFHDHFDGADDTEPEPLEPLQGPEESTDFHRARVLKLYGPEVEPSWRTTAETKLAQARATTEDGV